MIPARQPGFRVDREEEEIFLCHEQAGHVIRIDPVALIVWQLCDGTRPVAEIIELLQEAYPEAGDDLPGDVTSVLGALEAAGALRAVGA